jgi:SAM-dependent methyltransferase
MDQRLYKIWPAMEIEHWWFMGRRRIVMDLLKKYAELSDQNSRVLDVGCGTGGLLPDLAQYGSVWALEPDAGALSRAKKANPTVHFTHGTAPEDLPDKTFSLIVMLDVLEHIAADEVALKSVVQRLTPAGTLMLTVPAYNWLWSYHDEMSHHQRRYTVTELDAKLRQAGLTVSYISYYNTWLFLPVALRKILDRVGKWQKSHLTGRLPVLINKALAWLMASERYVLVCGSLPFGVSIVAIATNESD